jgi:hypothetical protein
MVDVLFLWSQTANIGGHRTATENDPPIQTKMQNSGIYR